MNASGGKGAEAISHLAIKDRVLCFLANTHQHPVRTERCSGHACGAVSYNRAIKYVGDGADELPSGAGPSRPWRRERSLMLVTTKEMLLDAQKNHYAVGAFNVENLEFVMAVLAAA